MSKTQYQMCYDALTKAGAMDIAFMDIVNDKTNPMTNDDLRALIARRPERYGKYAGFIGKLAD